jgi:ubiquinone/menaquinone biosynthesis C-methylase UbiE
VTSEAIKACCADLYSSNLARQLLGDSMHPGGLALTGHLGTLLGLSAQSRVLDLAAGRGASALYLAWRFGCQVLGVDYSAANVAVAQRTAMEERLADLVRFQQADAEHLAAFMDASFDAVICECALCTFPDKPAAMREIARVLAPGGRLGLSDLIRRGPLPEELQGLLASIAHIGDALPIEAYSAQCEAAGFVIEQVEENDDALLDLVREIRGRLLGVRMIVNLEQLELPGIDWAHIAGTARRAERAVADGILGYVLIVATKP